MRLTGNLPDEIWSRLKAWAKIQAQAGVSPSVAECAAHVERLSKELTGYADSLRSDVIEFYAAETSEMIARFQTEAS
jgi:hypothetical protein